MAKLNTANDQSITTDFSETNQSIPVRRGVQDWMEGELPITNDQAKSRLLQNDTGDARNAWAPNAADSSPAENSAAGIGNVTPLLPVSEVGELQTRWNIIQADFVDEPRRSVQEADKLVAATVQRLADGFANERASLERQWDSGDNVSTEDLRLAFQRYRAFFGRLLDAA